MGLGIGEGDEVICPSFTFFATAGCVARLGAIPVFAEIDPHRSTLIRPSSPKKSRRRRKRSCRSIFSARVANMDAINEIACKHELPVIEDAAQAIGAKKNGKPACSMGFAGCLSFYPTKNLGAFGDAGAICTNDDAFAEKCRKMRVHGSGHTYYHEWSAACSAWPRSRLPSWT